MSRAAVPSFKVVMLGNSSVGKTSLVTRWITGHFEALARPTISASHQIKPVTVDGIECQMFLWDTAGQEQYQALTPLYTRCATCAIIVVSVTDKISIQSVQSWVDLLMQSCDPVPHAILVFNKIDLASDDFDREAAILDRFRDQFSSIYFVSAKTGEGVEAAFTDACEQGFRYQQRVAVLQDLPPQSSSSCC